MKSYRDQGNTLIRHTAKVNEGCLLNQNSKGFPMMSCSMFKIEFSNSHVLEGAFRKTMEAAVRRCGFRGRFRSRVGIRDGWGLGARKWIGC